MTTKKCGNPCKKVTSLCDKCASELEKFMEEKREEDMIKCPKCGSEVKSIFASDLSKMRLYAYICTKKGCDGVNEPYTESKGFENPKCKKCGESTYYGARYFSHKDTPMCKLCHEKVLKKKLK